MTRRRWLGRSVRNQELYRLVCPLESWTRGGPDLPHAARATLRVLGVCLLLTVACSTPSPDPQDQKDLPGVPRQVLRNLTLRETTDGKLEWVLRARTAWRVSASSSTDLESLRVDFYQGSDAIRSHLVADSGSVDSEKGELRARGHVVVTTPEGNRLETSELFWDRKNTKVRSEDSVRLIRGTDVLTGVGFESDPNLEHYELFRDVRASVREGMELRDELFGADSSDTTN
jgi:LPS export ABC transporter protein LptC